MTVLITFICITLASAIAAGAFVYGEKIGSIKKDADNQYAKIKDMEEQIQAMTLEYRQLEMQYDQERHDNHRTVRPGGWNPEDLGNRN